MRDFVAVAEELHFTRAAARLHVAQPSLTRQVKNLEAELGVRLFERTRGAVTLTEPGRAFLNDARQIVELSSRSVESVQRQTRRQAATLSVACPPSFLYQMLPATLARYRNLHPNVTVTLSNLGRAEQLRALEEHRIDLGFVRGGEALTGTDLRAECVARYTAVLAVSASSPLARKRTISLAGLKPLLLVSLSAQSHPDYDEWIRQVCEEAGLTRRIVQKVNTEATLLALVAAGVGMALIPEQIRSLRCQGVVFLTPKPPIGIECCAVWRADNHSPLLQEYLQVVRQVSTTAR